MEMNGRINVHVEQLKAQVGTTGGGEVAIMLEHYGDRALTVYLTPDEAHTLAKALVAAANNVEAEQSTVQDFHF